MSNCSFTNKYHSIVLHNVDVPLLNKQRLALCNLLAMDNLAADEYNAVLGISAMLDSWRDSLSHDAEKMFGLVPPPVIFKIKTCPHITTDTIRNTTEVVNTTYSLRERELFDLCDECLCHGDYIEDCDVITDMLMFDQASYVKTHVNLYDFDNYIKSKQEVKHG